MTKKIRLVVRTVPVEVGVPAVGGRQVGPDRMSPNPMVLMRGYAQAARRQRGWIGERAGE